MKCKFFFAAAVAASVLASCSKTVDEEMPQQEEKTVRLNVGVTCGQTKVTGDPTDDQIKTIQVWSFNESLSVDGYAMIRDTKEITIDVPPGTKTIEVLVNAPQMPDIGKYDDLKSRVSDLRHNLANSMVMEGYVTKQNVTEDYSLTVPVRRLASRITLLTVKNDMEYLAHQKLEVKLLRAYLINVPCGMKFTDAFDANFTREIPDRWGNKMCYNEEDALAGLTLCDLSRSVLPYGNTYSKVHYMYSYANPTTEDSSSKTWGSRRTRLVVETQIGSDIYYYPVTLPVLEQNTEYQVNLTITRPGSKDPDVPYADYSAIATVNVVDWEESDDINAII